MCSPKKSRLTPSIEAASLGMTVTRGSALFGLPFGSCSARSRLNCSLVIVGTYFRGRGRPSTDDALGRRRLRRGGWWSLDVVQALSQGVERVDRRARRLLLVSKRSVLALTHLPDDAPDRSVIELFGRIGAIVGRGQSIARERVPPFEIVNPSLVCRGVADIVGRGEKLTRPTAESCPRSRP